MIHWLADNTTTRAPPVGVTKPVPCVAWAIETRVAPGALTYEWNLGRLLENRADAGENCAGYGKAYKYGKGASWVDCREAHDLYSGTDGGPLFVDELDYMGARDRKTSGAAVLCVVGRASETPHRDPNDHSVAHLPAFFRLVPYYPDAGYVKLDYFVRAEMQCEEAIVSMQGGDAIRFSDDPAVPELCFDNATGIHGLWFRKRRFCVRGTQVQTGEEFVMRQF